MEKIVVIFNDNNNNNYNYNYIIIIIIIIIIIRSELKTGIAFADIGLELCIFRENNGSLWIYLSFSIPNE